MNVRLNQTGKILCAAIALIRVKQFEKILYPSDSNDFIYKKSLTDPV